ncbi:hypothetical protein GCM10010987_37220 [Bradyrhizobium guangdongense]|uniref:2Fe-2S ferredoxin-type domain-containing protein n=1 Tax=Bradyrhizobium guangdongense TaxID=1325090 RepID=A0AA88B977_9BRAD|nr:hypothetical protein GCM10010987_37220 [Bradyrhizobium guangdongense]
MPAITFVHSNGNSDHLDASDGESAMQAATRYGLDGILAECGGNAMCATCHVYVDDALAGAIAGRPRRRGRAARWHRRGAAADEPAVLPDQDHV